MVLFILTAQVLAQIPVNGVLADVRTPKDEKFRSGLKAQPVLASLEKVTGRSGSLDMEGHQLVVSDLYGDYPSRRAICRFCAVAAQLPCAVAAQLRCAPSAAI
jgi:hypothetical protein